MASPPSGILQENRLARWPPQVKRFSMQRVFRGDDAGTWITTCVGERITLPWDTWTEFKLELKSQFGVIDTKVQVRIKLKNMKAGKRSVTKYWNLFCRVAREAALDNSTGEKLLPWGMNTELQNAWGASRDEYESTKVLAQWAIWEETKLATVRDIQGTPPTKSILPETIPPRNPDRIFRPIPNGNSRYGDLMELGATWRKSQLYIPREKYQRWMQAQLCLKWVQAGNLAWDCEKQAGSKPFNAQARNW